MSYREKKTSSDYIFKFKQRDKPCPIRTRPAIIIVTTVATLKITNRTFARFAIDTLYEFILMRMTKNQQQLSFQFYYE